MNQLISILFIKLKYGGKSIFYRVPDLFPLSLFLLYPFSPSFPLFSLTRPDLSSPMKKSLYVYIITAKQNNRPSYTTILQYSVIFTGPTRSKKNADPSLYYLFLCLSGYRIRFFKQHILNQIC